MDRSNCVSKLPEFIHKMENEGLDQLVIDTFAYYYEQIIRGETGYVRERDIRPINPDDVEDAEHLDHFFDAGKKALPHAVMIILNGGLGTSMGLQNPKSLIKAKNGKSFLEIKLAQAEHLGVSVCFMDSFNTHQATLEAISKNKPTLSPIHFLQNKFPKVLRDGLAPASWPQNPTLEWNPPGHGDIYTALQSTGTLEKLLDQDIRYAYICNSDNLGATLDESLLGYFVEGDIPFMMEISKRGPLDTKGGHLARLENDRLILREIAQCPKEDVDIFQDIKYHRFFNTNSIWIHLKALHRLIKQDGLVQLPMILNPKPLDPRNENSPPIYHIETAMGSAIFMFDNAKAVKVGKNRFLPVKTCNDLLARRSDRFLLGKDHKVILNPEIENLMITINLDPKYYGKIDLFDQRFPEGIPSLTQCESLTIKGDVRFESNVTIIGNVTIRNDGSDQAVIKERTIISDDLIV
jgi:UTP--glucose-1-phosphate uridylyltransferase